MKLNPHIKLELISGIKERRFCSGQEDSFSLAIHAVLDCLHYSSLENKDIEMIIYCGISKLDHQLNYYYEPSFSSLIKKELGIENALNFDISNACAGMLTGIYIANSYIKSGTVSNCLIISGEFISSICINAIKNIITPSSQELASLTVGDAGAAVVIEKTSVENGFEVLNLETFSQYSKLCTAHLSSKYPGAQMFTQMKKLFQVSIAEAPPFIEESLKESGLTYGDMDFVIPHQTAKRAILSGARNFQSYFKASPKEIIYNLHLYANTASTTHFLALYMMLKEKRIKKDQRILLLGFASGLVMGVLVFKLNHIIEKYG